MIATVWDAKSYVCLVLLKIPACWLSLDSLIVKRKIQCIVIYKVFFVPLLYKRNKICHYMILLCNDFVCTQMDHGKQLIKMHITQIYFNIICSYIFNHYSSSPNRL